MDELEENDNIIHTADVDYQPTGGMGYEFFRMMKLHEDNVAQYVVETGEKDTYRSLLKRCIRASLTMKLEEVTDDDIVCLCTDNHLNSTVPYLASMFLGVKVASLDTTLSINDTSYLLQIVKPKIIFLAPEATELIEESVAQANLDCKLVIFGETDVHEQFSKYLEPHEDEEDFRPVQVSPQSTAVIFFSSGTTGFPKGICQSHYALLAQGINIINNGIITAVNLSYSSLYWISSALFLTGILLSGTARVICKSFNPQQTWKLIDQYRISFLFLAPTQAVEMCKVGRPDSIDTSSLLVLFTGGGIFSGKQLAYLRDLLPGTHVCQAYGQTEVAGVLTCFKMNDVKDAVLLHYRPASCGRPILGISYKVVDVDTEKSLGPNQQGELRVKTKFAMNGYYNLDSSDSFDSEGWLKTGDLVFYDEDWCFYVVDRLKEMLKYKSWHIPPATLENVLNNYPAVKRAIVIGIPHEEDGDHPMAVVILNNPEEDVTSEEIEDYVAERVQERQKLRAGVKFVDSFPVTPSGKVKRLLLRKMILAGEI